MKNLATTLLLVAGAIAFLALVIGAPLVQAEDLTAGCENGHAVGSFKAEAPISTYLVGLEHTTSESDEWFEVPGTRLEFQEVEGTVSFTLEASRAPVQSTSLRIVITGYIEGEVVIELLSEPVCPCQVVGTPVLASPIPTESPTSTQKLVSDTSSTASAAGDAEGCRVAKHGPRWEKSRRPTTVSICPSNYRDRRTW